MHSKYSNKTRLLTLICMGVFPGGHRLYTKHYTTAISMIIISFVIKINIFILVPHFKLDYFFSYSQNFRLIWGGIALLIIASLCVGEILLLAITTTLSILTTGSKHLTHAANCVGCEYMLNITVLLLWFLAVWLLIDAVLISIGLFKDNKQLFLTRTKTEHSMSSRSNIVAILLCTFLAVTGLHRFYLNRYKSGVIMLALSSICLLLWPLLTDLWQLPKTLNTIGNYLIMLLRIVLNIWVLIDLLRLYAGIFTDANNKLPRDYSSPT